MAQLFGIKLRANDNIGKIKALMLRQSKKAQLVKVPVSLHLMGYVRKADLSLDPLQVAGNFWKSGDAEKRSYNALSQVDGDILDNVISRFLGHTRVFNVSVPSENINNKPYEVSVLSYTVPVLKYYNKPLDNAGRNFTVQVIDMDDLMRLSHSLGKKFNMPTHEMGNQLVKDENFRMMLFDQKDPITRFITRQHNSFGVVDVESGSWEEMKEGTHLQNNKLVYVGIIFVRMLGGAGR